MVYYPLLPLVIEVWMLVQAKFPCECLKWGIIREITKTAEAVDLHIFPIMTEEHSEYEYPFCFKLRTFPAGKKSILFQQTYLDWDNQKRAFRIPFFFNHLSSLRFKLVCRNVKNGLSHKLLNEMNVELTKKRRLTNLKIWTNERPSIYL